MAIKREDALEYHAKGRPGKIELRVTKPCDTQRDLSLAYSPGVAEPVREIAQNPDAAYEYTARGNLVAVISNGTAVLGLGDVGALAAKPVMEGKGVLFKRFADIDVFDLEINATDPDEMVRIIKALEPTFGGINLEDIKAPECFEIERRLQQELSIPVFHDDQHGTAIISGAALINGLHLVGKRMDEVRVVINGAGASAIATADFFVLLGVDPEKILMCDSKGVLYRGRTEGMNPYKEAYARETNRRTLAEALEGADVFVGLSVANVVSAEMVKTMAERPLIMPLANPDPEIPYEVAKEARPDALVATGRSDYPNQVNNVLGFPYIFRGALDVRARAINDEMKVAAAKALAELARQEVPDTVLRAYGLERLQFGPDYLIPKALDPRVLTWVAPAVAQAAMASGAARIQIDLDEYRERLARRFGKAREVKHFIMSRAQQDPKRVVFSEGEEPKIIRAAARLRDEGLAQPILLGDPDRVTSLAQKLGVNGQLTVISPEAHPRFEEYVHRYWEMRQRKGVTLREARKLVRQGNVFGPLMVAMGDADAFVAGLTYHYPEVLRPALQVLRMRPGVTKVAGLYLMVFDDKVYFFTDPTVNIEPTAEELAEIAIMAAERVRMFGIEPRVAMLSFSNFGSTIHPQTEKVRRAVELVRERRPDLIIDGEMQADTAVVPEILEQEYPFSVLQGGANVLVFPDLASANIAYKLLQRLGGAQAIGPILMGTGKSVHVLQRGDDVDDIVNIACVAVMDAQELERAAQHPEMQEMAGRS
ncbi:MULTISPECIES: NADP-dependent malic enzyme [Limnochorda]|uniref:NADP-dependent malic enzyme n=1 Tax=Limnochorda TaxID=1676651 RepID=UPI001D738D60|nr:NADP-dependent malic enzyme [Limnochorda pilosa]MBO2486823.1 NADP-dependent malic enzyme [Bacillota bacterium]MBO2519335.1 NADP-dependent malic enzyme [Bacillota bacterium]